MALLFWFFPTWIARQSALPLVTGGEVPRMLMAMYGSAALIPVIIGAWALREEEGSSTRSGLIILLIVFHTLLSLSQFLYNPDPRGGTLHLLLAAGLSAGWKKEMKR